jgi:hypothetical protein
MKKINLTRGYVALVSDIDYLRVLKAGPWYAHVQKGRTVYAERNVYKDDGSHTLQKMHRFILGLTDPTILTDHKDGNGLHNWRRNLRKATHSQNNCNKAVRKDNTSGYANVSFDSERGLYAAYINLSHKRTFVGRFTGRVAAHRAVEEARVRLHKGFARSAHA